MGNITRYLTAISPRSGPSPGRRVIALALCAMLVVGSTFPAVAVAGEADSEGEGTAPPIEVPVGPPDFDPGGEEEGLEEEAPASGGEEEGAAEAEVEIETPAPEEVTSAAPEAAVESSPPSAPPAPEPETAAAPEPGPQQAAEPAEPIINQSITAPSQKKVDRGTASASANSGEVPPAEENAPPPSPPPVAVQPPDPGRNLGGKGTYVVQPGDCLSYIAADLLPAGSDTQAIEDKVAELWRLNEDRIGTGDPNLIYPGTVLRLH